MRSRTPETMGRPWPATGDVSARSVAAPRLATVAGFRLPTPRSGASAIRLRPHRWWLVVFIVVLLTYGAGVAGPATLVVTQPPLRACAIASARSAQSCQMKGLSPRDVLVVSAHGSDRPGRVAQNPQAAAIMKRAVGAYITRVAGAPSSSSPPTILHTFRQRTRALSTYLGQPVSIATDDRGDIFFGEIYELAARPGLLDCDVREILARSRTIRVIAGRGLGLLPVGPTPALRTRLGGCTALAIGPHDMLYVVDSVRDEVDRINLANGHIRRVAGGGRCAYPRVGDGRLAIDACLNQPDGLAVNYRGQLFIADTGDNRIRVVGTHGFIHTLAGTGKMGFSGDGGLPTHARLKAPTELALNAEGDLLVADSGNGRIRVIGASTGSIGTIVGGGHCTVALLGFCRHATRAQVIDPTGLAVDGAGDIYLSNTSRIYEVPATTLHIRVIAGSGRTARTSKQFQRQQGRVAARSADIYATSLALEPGGRVVFTDFYQSTIREFVPG